MLGVIFESKFNFPAQARRTASDAKMHERSRCWPGVAPRVGDDGWPPQQASSAMTMRTGRPAQAAEHRGPGVAAGLGGPALACPLPLASAQRGTKASGDEALKATRPDSGMSGRLCDDLSALVARVAESSLLIVCAAMTRSSVLIAVSEVDAIPGNLIPVASGSLVGLGFDRGEAVLPAGVAELVHRSDGAQYVPVTGIFEEPY
jgi:hypothetical protein